MAYTDYEPYYEGSGESTSGGITAGLGGITYRGYSPTQTIEAQSEAATELAQVTAATKAGYTVVPTSSTTTSRTEYEGAAPKYTSPLWDEKAIRKLSRKISGAGIRQLRQQVQQQTAKYYENPNVRAIMLRNALQGYGIGLEQVISGAETQARSEYAQRYSFDIQNAMQKFQAAWNAWMATGKKVQETTTAYTTAGQVAGEVGTAASIAGTATEDPFTRLLRLHEEALQPRGGVGAAARVSSRMGAGAMFR